MIVQLTGNVNYPITLDPSVWIFDDRKVLLEEALINNINKQEEIDPIEKAADRWSKEVLEQRINPPVNKSITRFEREKILENSYVMPLDIFLQHAELKSDAKIATLETPGNQIEIRLSDLENSYLLFAVKGRPLKDDGPVHLYYKDGSNKNNPIKGIKNIIIK